MQQEPTPKAQDSADATADITVDAAPDYVNEPVQAALRELQQHPDYARLAAFLNTLSTGYLVVDVTGTTTKRKGTRVRTIRATNGKLVLPVFTSMHELRRAVTKGEPKGAIMPAAEALALTRTDRFAAIELDPAGAKQVLLRRFVELALADTPITAEQLEKQ